jgi:two-component system, chemotaxis family, sensor kinase CheA
MEIQPSSPSGMSDGHDLSANGAMANPQIVTQIQALQEALVGAKVGDLGSMAGVLRFIQDLEQTAATDGEATIVGVCDSAGEMVKRLLMDEEPDAPRALEQLRTAAALLAKGAQNGAFPSSDEFPEALRPVIAPPPVAPSTQMSYKDEDILADFLSRQAGVLQELEVSVLALEKGRAPESLAALLHILHTMKGDSGFLGLTSVEQLCHSTENYLQNAQYPYDVESLLMVKDWLASTFAAISTGVSQMPSADLLISRLEGLGRERLEIPPTVAGPGGFELPPESPSEAAAAASQVLSADPSLLSDFVSESREHMDQANNQLLQLESDPSDQEALNSVFRAFHTMKGISGFLGLSDISHLAHDTENLLDKVRRSELELTDRVMDLSFTALDMLGRLIEGVRTSLETGSLLANEPALPELLISIQAASSGAPDPGAGGPRPKLGEMLVDAGVITKDTLQEAIASQRGDRKGQKLGTILVEQNKVKPAKIIEVLQKQVPEQESRSGGIQVKDTIRVDYERLENMINTIGEMVLAESMISQDDTILATHSENLNKKVYNLRQVTRKLQELGTSIRMVPVAGTFQKMARLVRDLSKKSGKHIQFLSKGDETELDRAFVDKIADPLVHMIRNAVDHGIETPQERAAAGKSPEALVELRAFHEGGNIHIEIQDDGRGLNSDAIVAKAVEKGLITADERLGESEIFNLIFLPGFSTAKQITEVSGRGVGMDVVKRNIEELRGYVHISSERGKGTKFKIILPLTLALIDGMVVKIGAEKYIIPVLSVVESLRPPPGIVTTIIGKGEMVSLRHRQIALFRVAKLFGLPGAEEDPTKALIVVVEHEGKQAGLLVDDLIGMQQTVIKNLGGAIAQTMGVSGGAIMADGRIGLIMDVPGVLKLARNEGGLRRV